MRGILALVLLVAVLPQTATANPSETLQELFAEVPAGRAPSGVLYDRVLPLSGIADLDGSEEAPAIATSRWRQTVHELRRAADDPGLFPAQESLRLQTGGSIPVGVLDHAFDRLRQDAFDLGLASVAAGRVRFEPSALQSARVFAAAPLRDLTHRGEIEFVISRELYITDRSELPMLYLDADDGQGLRRIPLDGRVRVRYRTAGTKTLRVKADFRDGSSMVASSRFRVEALMTPAPNDTLRITASIPHEGSASTGEAYLYYASGRTSLERPAVIIEGFDLDDSMNWDELYALLNEQDLIEDVRAAGYDIVVLNFDDATTDIQRNSYLVVELIQQVQNLIDPRARFAIAGASMGGLCSRFALAWMEQNGIEHRANTFLSFDAPHAGAAIPLGLQYWLDFFSGESADAAFLLSRLGTPAARQLLVYHHDTPPSSTASADSLRGAFMSELASLGDYPSQPRLVSIANGSGSGQDQGYPPGEQIIRWEYDSLLVDIRGNVWAVSDGPAQLIFEGLINPILLPSTTQDVTVSGTDAFDSAPGGSRNSMAQADSTEAPYGDIVALHPDHCFIPTVSALDLPTTDLFFDVDDTPDLASLTPFDAVYFPNSNQGHVEITVENAAWFKAELFGSPTGAPAPQRLAVRMDSNSPNPFNPSTSIRLEVFESAQVRLDVYDLRGRHVIRLLDGQLEAGERRVEWNGTDGSGRPVASGVYVARLSHGTHTVAQRMALVR